MRQIAQQLRRTFRARTADMGAVFIPCDRSAANGAVRGKLIRHGIRRPFFLHDPNDLRDDLSCLLHQDRVADADVFFCNIVLVVEGSIGDSGTS